MCSAEFEYMQLCIKHNVILCQQLISRGMGDFIATSYEEAVHKYNTCMQSRRVTLRTFEPTLIATMILAQKSVPILGPHIMAMGDFGDHSCAICELEKLGHNDWPGKVADDVQQMLTQIKE